MARRRIPVPLRWSDVDAYGHVNNVEFLRLLEEARVRLVGLDAGRPDGPDAPGVRTGLIVARSEIEYLDQLTYRLDPVPVDVWVTAVGGADFELGYEVLDPGPDGAHRVYARAATTLVSYDLDRGGPRRLTAPERARLQEWRDGPVAWRRRRGPVAR